MNLFKKKLKIGRRVATITYGLRELEVAAINLAGIGLEGTYTRLRGIVKELDDIENAIGLQFREFISKEKE